MTCNKLLIIFLLLPFFCSAQSAADTLFSRYIISGDSCWQLHDTSNAQVNYRKAKELQSWNKEADYRLAHVSGPSSCKLDKNVTQFFRHIEEGDYYRKDHSLRAAKESYKKALAIAEMPGYKELKKSTYYKYAKEHLRH